MTVKLSDEARQEMARRYRAGESLSQLADGYDMCVRVVRKFLVASGVEIRPAKGRGARLSEDSRKLIAALASSDEMTYQDVADLLTVSVTTVARVSREINGLARPRRHGQEIKFELRARYEDGATCAQLAAEFGMNESQVGRYLHEVGTAMRPPGIVPKKTRMWP